MKKIMLLLVGLLLIWSLPAGAVLIPITEIIRDEIGELNYAEFGNTGELVGVFEGNDSNQWGDIEDLIGFQLTESFKDEFGDGATSGKWDTSPDAIQLYIVKAGDALAIYQVDPLATFGTWSTYDLWLRGLGGKGGLEISHLTGTAPVPEPATMLLFGVGLMGIAGLGRKKLIKKQ